MNSFFQQQAALVGSNSEIIQLLVSKSATELAAEERANEVQGRLYEMMDEAQLISQENSNPSIAEITTVAADEINKLLLNAIPTVPLPEFAILEAGGVSIEWFGSNGNSFAINSRGTGRLAFSGWFDNDSHLRGHFLLASPLDVQLAKQNINRVLGL